MSEHRRDAASALAHGCVTSSDIEAVRRELERARRYTATQVARSVLARDVQHVGEREMLAALEQRAVIRAGSRRGARTPVGTPPRDP